MTFKTRGFTPDNETGEIILFYGKETVRFKVDDHDSVDRAEQLLHKMYNEAEADGAQKVQSQIKDALGINEE
ncbi:MAG: hypothetical protein JXR12_05290 [Neptunomonas phycophila]|uniref:hypothetical protein n=1 Tax=Neptunomonas phycophila TaxID=1572645 RepID=UPI003B8CAC92